jgi:[ribosomal protein S18]-alanine N-acetyltransferase
MPAPRSPGPIRIVRLGSDPSPLRDAAPDLFDHPLSPPAAQRYLRDRRNVLWVARDGSRTVGFLRGTTLGQLHSRRRQMFLYEVAVTRGWRRRGIGRALVRALLAYCRARGYEEVFVFTDPHNRAAVALYRSTGGRTETAADRMYVYALGARAGSATGGSVPRGAAARRLSEPLRRARPPAGSSRSRPRRPGSRRPGRAAGPA